MVRRVLYINDVEIPLSETLSMPVTYQIADIAQPESRQGNYSKTIDIPSSKVTDALFGYLFDVTVSVDTSGTTNFNPDFNPNLKASAKILGDSIEEFNGFAQLVDISVIDRTDIVYHVMLLGKLTNLIDDIGDKELGELDFSEYNHTYNRTEVENSWSSVPGSGYLYELIDRGFSTDLTNFPLTSFYPSLYEREIMLKIFRAAGYVWDSDFLDSLFYKKQTVPFNSPFMRLGASAILNRKFRASKTGTSSVNVTSLTNTNIVFDDKTTSPNFDTSSQYDNATGAFTVATGLNGVFTFNVQVVMGFTATPTTAGVSVKMNRNINASYQIIKVDGVTGATTILANMTQVCKHIDAFTTTYTSSNPASSSDTDFSIPSTNRNYVYLSAANVLLNVGDIVRVRVSHFSGSTGAAGAPYFKNATTGAAMTGTYTLHTYADSYFFNTIDNANLVEGMPVLMNDCLPLKIKQKDWLVSQIRKYNLYFEQDPDQSNKFKIEPRPDYYTNEVVDWTQKLDQGQELKIIPMGALDFKHLTIRYKEDKDYFNEDYQNKRKETYGQRDIDIVNDFLKNTKTIELIYSPTISVGNGSSNRIIPRIISMDESGTISSYTGNLRCLYYAGLKTSNTTWYITDSTGAHPYNVYPHSGMVDDPYDPTIDIGFGVPLDIYWQPIFDDINYTNNNLYNRYYSGMILDIASPNSKLVRGKFNLSVIDIATLDFRKLYYFEGEYFRLNKVIDYDPISDELTECEFLKVSSIKTFTESSVTTIGDLADYAELMDGILVDNSLERTPDYTTSRMPNNNTGYTRDGVGAVYGFNNRIGNDVQGYFIKGNNNSVGDYAKNVTIMDSSGVTVMGGTENVTVVRSNGVTVNESDVYVLNGQYYSKSENGIELIDASRSYGGTARFVEVDATNGNIAIALDDVALYKEPVTFIRMDNSSNSIGLNPSGSQLINGQLSYTGLLNQYDTVTIFPDSTQWLIISKNSVGYTLFANAPTLNPADATTYYWGAPFTVTTGTVANSRRVYVPRSGTIKSIYLSGTVTTGSNESVSFYLRLNNTTDTTISTAVDMSASPFTANITGLSVSVVAGDYFEIKEITPTWVTNPTARLCTVIVYIE